MLPLLSEGGIRLVDKSLRVVRNGIQIWLLLCYSRNVFGYYLMWTFKVFQFVTSVNVKTFWTIKIQNKKNLKNICTLLIFHFCLFRFLVLYCKEFSSGWVKFLQLVTSVYTNKCYKIKPWELKKFKNKCILSIAHFDLFWFIVLYWKYSVGVGKSIPICH